MTVTITKAGCYDIPEEDYHADPVPGGSLSCSLAKLILPPGCPAKVQWARKHPPEPRRVLEFGSAAHREVLGTGWDYAVWYGDDWSSKASQDWRREQRAAGRIPLLAREREQIGAMAAAIANHPTAALLLQAEEVHAEQSFFWTDDETRLWLRQRCDALRLHGRILITDYKTCQSADPEEFAKAAARYRYHWQDAWYRDGLVKVWGEYDPGFVFVAQEKDPPYLVGVYELNTEALIAGREQIARARRKYADCEASGDWPGVQPPGEQITKIRLPRWGLV
jgi:hypothetical protein